MLMSVVMITGAVSGLVNLVVNHISRFIARSLAAELASREAARRAEIERQAKTYDQDGNPQASGMLLSWLEADSVALEGSPAGNGEALQLEGPQAQEAEPTAPPPAPKRPRGRPPKGQPTAAPTS